MIDSETNQECLVSALPSNSEENFNHRILKKRYGSMPFVVIVLLLLSTSLSAQSYVPDDGSSQIAFKIRNFGAPVTGKMKRLRGTIRFDVNRITDAHFDVTVDANTVDTGIGMRDNHLRKKDYFGVEEHPHIRFVSTKAILTKAGEGLVTGILSIKNVSKEITIPFTYKVEKGLPQFKGEFQINRRNFGVGGKSISLSDDVKVILFVSVRTDSAN